MKVIKKTGLVPVKDKDTGEVFGVSPEVARREVLRGTYALVTEIPSEYETEEVDGPEVNEEGFFVGEDRSDGAGKPKDEDAERIEIPEDWRSKHHLVRMKMAKELYPDFTPENGGKWTTELADQKIQEMVDQRTNPALV